MLNPSDDPVGAVRKTVPRVSAAGSPPGTMRGGSGCPPEITMLMAKESIMAPCNMHELKAKAASGVKLSRTEELRLEIYEKVNALGIGAQGLGGLTTVLDVKAVSYTHLDVYKRQGPDSCRRRSACRRQTI